VAVPPELVWLIERLRGTPSRRDRVRLLLEGRRLLRDLAPADRLAVARELGFDGAERLVSEVAEKRGFSAEPWLRMLDEVEAGAADEVPGIVRGLIDPATRKESVSRMIDTASGWVADLDAYRPVPPSPDTVAPSEADVDPDPEETETPHPTVTDEILDWSDEAEDIETIDASEHHPEPAPEEAEVAQPQPQPPSPEPVDTDHEPLVEPPSADPEPVPHSPPAEAVPIGAGETTAADADARAAVDRLIARLEGHTSSSARLSALRESLPALSGVDTDALTSVLGNFPEGWARRRALETLFRAGLPDSLVGSLELLRRLTRRSERWWALTTLAASRRLSELEADALLAAADSPALARRLAHRLRATQYSKI
jgi:hypothetical protein